MTEFIYGSGGGGGKGGGGGGGRVATEDPNTLKSVQYAQIVDIISEGEVVGLVKGPSSIYLDDVPLTEFSDAYWEFRTGTQTQAITNAALRGSSSTIEVGVQVKKLLEDGVTSGKVVKTIDATYFDAGIGYIDVTVGIPVLTYQDMTNGDVHGTDVTFEIAIATNSGSYSVVHTPTISGKCTSMYNASYTVAVAQYARSQYPLSLRVSRITDDSTKSNLQNPLYWTSYTVNYPVKLNYPNTALATLTIDSDHFSSIPTRSYEIYGIKVKVPSNYDPLTRVYTGSWDGTFKIWWTDNPAWIYYDLVTDTRYGIGEYITEKRIDKWELYTIAKYCDELVPDGIGGLEPRFTCNTYIQSQDEAYKLLSDLCSIFRGMQYWAGGYLSVSVDMPKDAVAEFTTSNVIDGIFNYSGSSLKTRRTAVRVIWNDPTDAYKQKVEYVEANGFVYDQNNPNYAFNPITSYGIVQADLVAIGCTSRGQANRAGRWLLYTELYETETVTFKTGLENASLMPGSIIKTADPFRQGKRMGGRVQKRISDQTLELDVLDGELQNNTYTLSFVIPTKNKDTEKISTILVSYAGTISTSTSSGNKIFVIETGTFDTAIQPNSIWVGSQLGILEPELWRVISIAQDDEITATITALEYHPGKFQAIESGLLLQERPVSQIDYGRPSTPTTDNSTIRNFVIDLYYSNVKTTLSEDINQTSTSNIVCDNTEGFSSSGYIRIDNELIQYTGKTDTSFTGITRAVDGLIQPATSHSKESTIVQVLKLSSGTGWVKEYLFFQSPGSLSTAAMLSWSANAQSYEIKYKRVLENTTSWNYTTSTVPYIELKPLEAGLYDVEIVAINTLGRRSLPMSRTINLLGKSAPPRDVTNFSCEKSFSGLSLSWDANDSNTLEYPDIDLAGYEIRELYYTALPQSMQEVNGSIVWSSNVSDSQKNSIWNTASEYKVTDGLITTTNYSDTSIPANKYNVFLIKARDTTGNYSYVPSISGKKINPPSQITTVSIGLNGDDLVISWVPPISDIGIDYYELIYSIGDSVYTIKCQTPEFRKKLWFTGYETFDIIAYDIGGNYSTAKSVEVTIGNIPAPISFSNSIIGENFMLSWQPPSLIGASPIEFYEIRTDLNWGQVLNRVTTTSSTTYSSNVNWSGDRQYYIAAKGINGIYGTVATTTVSSPIPGAVTSLIPTVVDNNVLFTWTAPTIGTALPIVGYELRKGAKWETSSIIGTKQGQFTTSFETIAGTYTYWLAAINSAGTYGTPKSCTVVVNQPPDYILATNYFSNFIDKKGTNGTIITSNAHTGMDGKLLIPVAANQSWIEHFTSNGYNNINDFVAAGSTTYVEPKASTGYYQEIVDLDTIISGSTVSLAINKDVVSGVPNITYEVSVSSDNITYYSLSNSLINYFTQFRYVKFKLIVTGGIIRLNTLNFRLDVKQKSTSGNKSCLYSDTNGSLVYLTEDKTQYGNKIFYDVISINLTPNIGCTNSGGEIVNTVTAIYDFTDIPNPLSFKILLYNSLNGERLSGSCSYTIRGI